MFNSWIYSHAGNRLYSLVLTTVGALSIPVVCSIAINNVAVSTSDGVIGTGNDDRIEVRIESSAKALCQIIRSINLNKNVADLNLQLCQQK